MFWIVLALLAAAAAVVKTVGNVHQVEAQAAEDKRKADQLEELSKPGGYYDQTLSALDTEMHNIEADRAAAGKMLGLTAAQYAQQEIQVARQGAQATGSIAATAGAGNLGQGGSIEQRKGLVKTQVSENMATIERQIQTARLQYEGQLRGMTLAEAQTTAQITLAQFNKDKAISDAAALNTEADWLTNWGIPLTIAGGVLDLTGSLLNIGQNAGIFNPKTATSSSNRLTLPTEMESDILGLSGYTDPYASYG